MLRATLVLVVCFSAVSAAAADRTLPYADPIRIRSEYSPKFMESKFTGGFIEFTNADVPKGTPPGDITAYQKNWDLRAMAVLRTGGDRLPLDLLHYNDYKGALASPNVELTHWVLPLLAYQDFSNASEARRKEVFGWVSNAVMAAKPGWSGTFGAGMNNQTDILSWREGNYDMQQMHLIPIVYRYGRYLDEVARDRLVTELIPLGRIERPAFDDSVTSGPVHVDWQLAGEVLGKNIGESENHILMILATRYLANQLIYQRNPGPTFNNRTNGVTDLILSLMREWLTVDFSEYNAKPYQKETRLALLNLATFAYESEVKLAARMVLDYVAAHVAVTSNDLRRMMPFRRINECSKNSWDAGLIDWQVGADPLVPFFMLQTGNVRALSTTRKLTRCGHDVDVSEWHLDNDGTEPAVEVVSDYRLPPAILDLFVNDRTRRFYQRMHRFEREEVLSALNCNNMELTASSPSYLITAGGKGCPHANNPYFAHLVDPSGEGPKQLGISVGTSFMPTGSGAGRTVVDGSDLIQFDLDPAARYPARYNGSYYGVAPDIAFGSYPYLPDWVKQSATPVHKGFIFVNKKSPNPGEPGFFLAIYLNGDVGLLEAYDTLLDPKLKFEEFQERVISQNKNFILVNGSSTKYVTQRGHTITLIVEYPPQPNTGQCVPGVPPTKGVPCRYGSRVLRIDYATEDQRPCAQHENLRLDCIGDAGNIVDQFLNGTVLNSHGTGRITISNVPRDERIELDLSDKWNPRRTDENGRVATRLDEIWVDFDHRGAEEGNFYNPYRTLEAAAQAVANGGVIRLMPSSMGRRQIIRINKHITLKTPISFRIGAPQ